MADLTTLQLVTGGLGTLILGVAALLTIIRIARGPSILDRVVAADVLIAVVIAGLVIEEVINRHAWTVPVILALSLIGFTGSVAVAQLVAGREARRAFDAGGTGGTAGTDPGSDPGSDPRSGRGTDGGQEGRP